MSYLSSHPPSLLCSLRIRTEPRGVLNYLSLSIAIKDPGLNGLSYPVFQAWGIPRQNPIGAPNTTPTGTPITTPAICFFQPFSSPNVPARLLEQPTGQV